MKIYKITEAIKNNALEVKEILDRYCDKHVEIIVCDYIAYQGNAGKYNDLIKEVAIKVCENKRHEIIKVIRDGILEILDDEIDLMMEVE